MAYPRCCCSPGFWILALLSTAVPFAYLISLELSPSPTPVFHYRGSGLLRECAKWDSAGRRFLVSFFEGGIGQVVVPREGELAGVLDEATVVKDADLAGNASLGISIDAVRNRLLVAVADVIGNKYSGVAGYDLSTWRRVFLTTLPSPPGETSFADDVAVDSDGNAYVTDVKASKIWKVDPDGNLLYTIRSPLFVAKEWYRNIVALNGIVYHPDGYLLVIHTFSGKLFKVGLAADSEGHGVDVVEVAGGPLTFGDGIELLSPSELVVAGNPSGRLVESRDGWRTASVVGVFKGPSHRLATAATVRDGKVYLSHMIGIGYPNKKHALVQAVF